MLVLTAPTGTIGRQVVRLVLQHAPDEHVRVVARDPDRLPAGVRDRVEVVAGSHGDPAVVDRALDGAGGADALFWLLPTDHRAPSVEEAYVGFSRPGASAVRRHEVGRVVTVSALGRGTPWATRAGHVTGSLAMDDLFARAAGASRALACAGFVDNLLRQVDAVRATGTFHDLLTPSRRLPLVATRDIAATAAGLLLDRTWVGHEEVPLLGPEDLSMADLAGVASRVLGTPVRYEQVGPAAFVEQMVGHGMSAAMAEGLRDMMLAKDAGLDDGRSRVDAATAPTTAEQWCRDVLLPAYRTGG